VRLRAARWISIAEPSHANWASLVLRRTARRASDRDFALDYLYALAVIATHLSRLSEDYVLFASQEFGFIVLPDEFRPGAA